MPAVTNTMCAPVQLIADRIDCLFSCGAPHFGVRAGAKAFGHLGAHAG